MMTLNSLKQNICKEEPSLKVTIFSVSFKFEDTFYWSPFYIGIDFLSTDMAKKKTFKFDSFLVSLIKCANKSFDS